jgi:hypothetical protein
MWMGARGSAVVKALRYKPEGRGFEIRPGEWFLSSYLILPTDQGPGVFSGSIRNDYQRQRRMLLECTTRAEREADNPTAICELTV